MLEQPASLSPVHPHVSEHAWATHLLQIGADLQHIQELLGHSHIISTKVYTQVHIEDLKSAVRKSVPGKNLLEKEEIRVVLRL